MCLWPESGIHPLPNQAPRMCEFTGDNCGWSLLEEPLPPGDSFWCVNIWRSGQPLFHVPMKGHFKNCNRLCWVLPARNKLKDKTSEPSNVLGPLLPRALGRICSWVPVQLNVPPASRQGLTGNPRGQRESPYWYWWLSWSYIQVVHNKYRAGTHEGDHSFNEHSCLAHTTEASFSLQLSSLFFFFTINLISFIFVFACIYVCVLSVFLCLECTEARRGHWIPCNWSYRQL